MRHGLFVPGALALVPVLSFALAFACGPSARALPDPEDGGELPDGTFVVAADADGHMKDSATPVESDVPWARMEPHSNQVLPNMRLQAIYIGFQGEDGSPDFDEFQQWLLTSGYWGIMKQYGVSAGTFQGSLRISALAAFPPGMVKEGLVSVDDLDARIFQIIHGTQATLPEAGADGGGEDAGDASDDSEAGACNGDSSVVDASVIGQDSGLPSIPQADGYIFFLPNGVNVSLGNRDGQASQTCVDAGGYHDFDGTEPYAVIPPCSFGRSPLAISHELAEMATDPFPGSGWFSDADVDNAGGEIGDLCNQAVPHGVDGWSVTQLWSNRIGRVRAGLSAVLRTRRSALSWGHAPRSDDDEEPGSIPRSD